MNEIKKLFVFFGLILLGCGFLSIYIGIYVFGVASFFTINIGIISAFGLLIGGIILIICGFKLKL